MTDLSKINPKGSFLDLILKSIREDSEKENDREIYGSFGVRATPLVELISISIHRADGEAGLVYGTVEVIDGEGAKMDFYSRKEDNAEKIDQGGLLTLTLEKGRVISPFYEVVVNVNIKDKSKKDEIANERLILNYSDEVEYDTVRTGYVKGECGYAAIRYITHRHAVSASVNMVLLEENSNADVYGTVVARCGSDCSSVVLFQKTIDQSVRVKDGAIRLSRFVIAVPAYGKLVIEADLWNRDNHKQICQKKYEFDPLDYTAIHWTGINNEGQNEMIRVAVRWSHLYLQPPPERIRKHMIEEASKGKYGIEEAFKGEYGIEEASDEEKLESKKLQVACSNQDLSLGVDRNVDPPSFMENSSTTTEGFHMLEVFSVVVVSNNGKSFDLWGTIKTFDSPVDVFIFDKEKKFAVTLLSNQFVPLVSPTRIPWGHFMGIKLNLKDGEGRILSRGLSNWNGDDEFSERKLCNKPLCSIVKGYIGYAAVHYAVFSSAMQAKVKAYFESSSSSSSSSSSFSNMNRFQVHGSVFTEHSNFKYATSYEKERYRNKLFEKSLENPEVITSDFEVPLSKYLFGVSLNSALIVDVNLKVTSPQTKASDAETFQGKLQFPSIPLKTNVGVEIRKRIEGSRQSNICFCVVWSYP